MSRRLIIRPEAETDIVAAAIWYEGRERGLGLEVTSEIHAAMVECTKGERKIRSTKFHEITLTKLRV